MTITDREMYSAALIGFEQQGRETQAAIDELKRRLGLANGEAGEAPPRRPHRISPEGRARIAAAQRRRWDEAKQKIEQQEQAQQSLRASRVDALAKARAAKAARRAKAPKVRTAAG